jgi:HTH-type transcriptional regulator/antitoxin HigA
MTATKRKRFNPRVYGELLLDVLPRPIETEAENERALAVVDRLMSKGEDNLTPEETTLLELLVQLIERFE